MTKIRVGSGISVKAGRPSNIKVSEEGVFKGSQPEINFTGNANVTNEPNNNRVNVDIPASGGGGDAFITNTAVALTDGAAITLTATKHTLTTAQAAVTITDSYAG